MFTTPETQLFKDQYDILYELTDKNPYLKYSSRASKNKALKTSDKRIIMAINENKAAIDSLSSTTITRLVNQDGKIGNLDGDPQLNADFQATGYSSLADGLIKLHAKSATETKNIFFIFPKVIATTNMPEIYVPLNLHIISIYARYSEIDNSMGSINQDIKIELQHTIKENPTSFITFKEIVIPTGQSFVSEDFETDLPIGVMKAVVTQMPSAGIQNLNITVTSTENL